MTSEPRHTNIGCGWWSWPPYDRVRRDKSDGPDVGAHAAHLLLVLFAGRVAKAHLPGLWVGGIGTMADDSRLSYGEAEAALALLERHVLVEYDPQATPGVLRICALPDRCERAQNPGILRAWYSRRQQQVPPCGVRDRHLELVDWLHPRPFKPTGRAKADAALVWQEAWDETFGHLLNTLPAYRGAPRSTQPSQLLLYATPDQTDGAPHRQGKGRETEKVKGEGEGGSREPVDNEDNVILMARAGLTLAGGADLWPTARRCLQAIVGTRRSFEHWIEQLEGRTEITDQGVVLQLVGAPNEPHRDHVRDQYAPQLASDLRRLTGRPVRVIVV